MGRIPTTTLALLVTALLALPGTAAAATTVSSDGTTITVSSIDGSANNVTVTSGGPGSFHFADTSGLVTGAGCTSGTCPGTQVSADLGAGNDVWHSEAVTLPGTVTAGDGDDIVYTGAGAQTLFGGNGLDRLNGGLGADTIDGGSDGNIDIVMFDDRSSPVTVSLAAPSDSDGDTLVGIEGVLGGAGNDTITGGAGSDFLDGGRGSDTISGGGGTDMVGYWERSDAVTVRLGLNNANGSGGDPALGENDTIAPDVENAGGGLNNDLIVGNEKANWISGGFSILGPDGDDVLQGRGGSDHFSGGSGSDTVDYSDRSAPVNISLDGVNNDGGDAIDTDVENIIGGSGPDTLTGNAGPNVLTGGPGVDTLNGLGGDDVFVAREDEADNVNCGPGLDSGTVDLIDLLSLDCEADVAFPPPADPPAGTGSTDSGTTDGGTTDSGTTGTDSGTPPATDPPATGPPAGGGDKPTPAGEDQPDAPVVEAPVTITTPDKVAVSASGDIQIGVKCTAASGTCDGSIAIYEQAGTGKLVAVSGALDRRVTRKLRKGKLLGKKKFAVRAGKTKNVVVRLSRNGRRRVIKKRKAGKKAKPVKAIIAISVTAPDGTVSTTEKGVTLQPPKPRRVIRKHSDNKGKR